MGSNRQKLMLWLTDMEVNCGKLQKECADGVLVAKLIKKFYPRHVELHNYTPCSGYKQKVDNWQTLNKRVLTRLGLQQSEANLKRLARGDRGALELLLHDIMMLAENDSYLKSVWSEDSNVVTVPGNDEVGDDMQLPVKMIRLSVYEELLKDTKAVDQKLEVARGQIAELEGVLQSKSEELDELQAKVDNLSCRRVPRTNRSL